MSNYYICIDLKSFYASVECAERGLDPMTTDLVVADPSRDKGTICLAVSPSLKAKGVKTVAGYMRFQNILPISWLRHGCSSISTIPQRFMGSI